MNLVQELLLRTHHLAHSDVLYDMGYATTDESALAHLQTIRESPYLGLETTYRDARYGERGFLEALCRCVGLDTTETLFTIDRVSDRLAEDRAAYRHWLFADTDYVRGSGTPIFAMAFNECFRRLKFPIGFWRLPYEERLAAACQKAHDHMQHSGGKLDTWGEIKRYHYCHSEKLSIIISTTGEVIGEQRDFEPPRATFGISGDNQNLSGFFDREN